MANSSAPLLGTLTSQNITLAMISDTGGPIASGTSFYYNVGSNVGGFVPTNSFGPGPQAVSSLVQSWKPSEVFAIGDIAYNVSASTVVDASVGQYYNNFIYPYPSPAYSKDPYLSIGGRAVTAGQRTWPYNLYNFPAGFPNPMSPKAATAGGSPDKANHFWSALGNHDYGMEIGYGQIGVTPYNFNGNATGNPLGPTSTTTLRSSIDYLLPFLDNPDLLGENKNRLNIGAADKSGNRGAYYSINFGGSAERPLIEFFLLDTERLNVNAGMEQWNSALQGGQKTYKDGRYVDEVNSNANYSLTYNPTNPSAEALAGTTDDPNNGFDQYQWLRRSLDNSKAKWKVIAGHHPVYASGRWSDTQPDDHMSNAYLQRLLNALPAGSFDAYYNGHNHFYERVLESKPGGIGLGIPFITNGNSGRNLERKIQIPYGSSVYAPPAGGFGSKTSNPNEKALPQLLNSAPVTVGASGLSGTFAPDKKRFANGLYGNGFGAVKVDTNADYLLFSYQEAPVIDPAIANHLSGGPAAEPGFASTSPTDWIPNPQGSFDPFTDLAQFKLSINNGMVTGVELKQPGKGYMSSKGGNYTVRGFNIYGNNVDITKPWANTAQVDLTFSHGKLTNVELTDGGSGYELAVQSAAENNNATSTDSLRGSQELIVAINYNLEEIQYQVRAESLYNDWYMISDTQATITLHGTPGKAGYLQVQMLPKAEAARALLSHSLKPTTGYSGVGSQSFSTRAASGNFSLSRNDTLIASGTLQDGTWFGAVSQLPTSPQDLAFNFDGDPITSYNVNFKASSGSAQPTFQPIRSRGERAYYMAQAASQTASAQALSAFSADPLALQHGLDPLAIAERLSPLA
jgi:hypothetical protein